MESASVDVRDELETTLGKFDIALETLSTGLLQANGIELTTAQKRAASFAGLAAHDVRGFITHEPRAMVATENSVIIGAPVSAMHWIAVVFLLKRMTNVKTVMLLHSRLFTTCNRHVKMNSVKHCSRPSL